MNLSIVKTSLLSDSKFDKFKVNPDFRKATQNMLQAYAVVEDCLSQLTPQQQDIIKSENYGRVGLVMGTSLGELQITKDFLLTLENQGMARPILFQNSLHNATLGFVTLQLQFTGPSVTISERFFTAESSLHVAELFLQFQEVDFVFVVCTEVLIPEFLPGYSLIYPKGTNLTQGACAFLVASSAGIQKLNITPQFAISAIHCDRSKSEIQPINNYYDSDGLERIRSAIIESKDQMAQTNSLLLEKPDGSRSHIELQNQL